jgi:hypothetical protein
MAWPFELYLFQRVREGGRWTERELGLIAILLRVLIFIVCTCLNTEEVFRRCCVVRQHANISGVCFVFLNSVL